MENSFQLPDEDLRRLVEISGMAPEVIAIITGVYLGHLLRNNVVRLPSRAAWNGDTTPELQHLEGCEAPLEPCNCPRPHLIAETFRIRDIALDAMAAANENP